MSHFVASSMGMAAAFYAAASFMLWVVIISGWKRGNKTGFNARSVMLDRGVAWIALTIIFTAIAFTGSSFISRFWLDLMLVCGGFIVTAMGLISVRQITRHKFGHLVLAWFVGIVLLAGTISYSLSY